MAGHSVSTSHRVERAGPRAAGVTTRVVVLSIALAPLNALWVVRMEGAQTPAFPTIVSIYFNVIFILLIATVINHIVRRTAPRWALSHAELVSFYTLMSILTSCVGYDTIQFVASAITGVYRYGDASSGWPDLFFAYLPRGMIIDDPKALDGLWAGGSRLLDPQNLGAVAGPLVRWWAFLSALWLAPLGLAVLFRRRWIESERLTFPIIHLPLQIASPEAQLFRSRAMWAGFTIAAALNLLNGLHVFYPAVPQVAVKLNQIPALNIGAQLIDRPWNAIGGMWFCFHPFIIGLALLLPIELPASCALFYLFFKAERVGFVALGMTQKPEFPYLKEQSYGGYVALLVFSLWAGRHFYVAALKRALRVLRDPIDAREPISFRAAVLLFAAGATYAVYVGVQQRMTLWVSLSFFALYFLMTCIVGRIRAEMGLPTHEMERLGPTVMLGNILGRKVLGAQNLTSASLFFGFTRGIRNVPFPHEAEGFKLMERTGGSSRRLLIAMGAMTVIGLGLGLWAHFHLAFKLGYGAQWSPIEWAHREAWGQLANWLNDSRGFDHGRFIAIVIGFVFYFSTMVLRTSVLWWPIHPAGFALSTTYFMDHMWFPFLLASTARWILTRYAGPTTFHGVAMFALGLILGDVGPGCLWNLYGIAHRVQAWTFWP